MKNINECHIIGHNHNGDCSTLGKDSPDLIFYVENVKKAYQKYWSTSTPTEMDYHLRQLLSYLEPFTDHIPRSVKMVCEICKNPLYQRHDGSLVCLEMKH